MREPQKLRHYGPGELAPSIPSGHPTVLNIAPHADDEMLGAPATLLHLLDAGWRVVNLALSAGPDHQRPVRFPELLESCARAGFELLVPSDLQRLGSLGDGEVPNAGDVVDLVTTALAQVSPTMVVAPSPTDGHPAHEVVGRATIKAIADCVQSPRLLMWSLWGNLPRATTVTWFDDDVLHRVQHALSAHASEMSAHDYRVYIDNISSARAVLATRLVWGNGVSVPDIGPRAELLTETQYVTPTTRRDVATRQVRALGLRCPVAMVGWKLGVPRHFDASVPAASQQELDPRLLARSACHLLGPPGRRNVAESPDPAKHWARMSAAGLICRSRCPASRR